MTDNEHSAEQQPHWTPPPVAQPYYGPPPVGQPYIAPQAGQPYWTPPPVAPVPLAPHPHASRRRKAVVGSIAAAAVTALAIGVTATVAGRVSGSSSDRTVASAPNNNGTNPFSPFGQGQTTPNDGSGSGSGTNTTGTATSAEQVGVVNIDTVLNFGSGRAAGTGVVLSSSGEILTNNHVVEGSTSITVTVVTTGKQYTAAVVGTDPTDDVAVLQLKDASGLQTAKLGDSSTVAVGDAVTAVGNAGGKGGTPTSATGTVTALDQSITAADSNGSNAEQLTGMIEIDADIQAGDSGGPLYSASDAVIGIDTAASSTRATGTTTGFAIPIVKAVSIADQIESGRETTTIHIGYPAFLGVQLDPRSVSGAGVSGVVDGSAAAAAGIQAGDTITSVGGMAVSGPTRLASVLGKYEPGQQVSVRWVDSAGQSHSATVTLGSGPAD
jgi:S1-C subfamily serine protease